MAESKRYYWIKLKHDFFDLDAIDWLQSQENGCEYIVLYQKLCLIAANKNGELLTRIGEMLIPYDINKIARDTKFGIDTVAVAMGLFKKLGLIYQQENGAITIPYINEIVGSESESAQRVRKYRALQCNKNVTNGALQCNEEYRDKSIEYRDIEIDNNIHCSDNGESIGANAPTPAPDKSKRTKFVPPTLEDVQVYCKETGKPIDAEAFINYYTSNGWKVGKNPMKDWKAAVRQWRRRDEENGKVYHPKDKPSYDLQDYDEMTMAMYKDLK